MPGRFWKRHWPTPTAEHHALFAENVRWCLWYVRRYGYWRAARCGMDHDDLRQQALLGLWMAVLQFDGTQGFKFRTYAARRVAWAMHDGVELWRYGRKPRGEPCLDHSALDHGAAIDNATDVASASETEEAS